jgi:hypothetical protein
MRLSWRSTPHTSNTSATQQPQADAAAQPAHGRLKRVLWFVALWCVGVAGAMLLALPFRLLMQAAMH